MAQTRDRDVSTTPAPWEQPAATAPRVTVTFEQLPSSKWVANRTVEFPYLDLADETAQGRAEDTLDLLDQLIRRHLQTLYDRDASDREEYFRRREAAGYDTSRSQHSGSWDNRKGAF